MPRDDAHPLVLIVEDEPTIARVLELYLRRDRLRTEVAGDGEGALRLFRAARPDLVLLDVNLPGVDGFEVLRRIRDVGDTPVVMVTAMGEPLERLLGFRLGVDDYVVKPFDPLEVVARVKAVLRRASPSRQAEAPLRFGPLEIDPLGVQARASGRPLDLTLAEYRLLEHLARHPGRAWTRAELLEACLPSSDALEGVMDTHVGHLRRKLREAGLPERVETVRGVGYRWRGDG